MTERLLTKANMTQTGNMHGILCMHVGMRIRLKRNISLQRGLVQEAEGVLVDVAFADGTPPEVRAVWAAQAEFVELISGEVPSGVWVLMDEYLDSPNLDRATKMLLDAGGGIVDPRSGTRVLSLKEKDCAQRLLFLERTTSFPFTVPLSQGSYKITRTQLPLTHACVRTCQSSQGMTFRGGVVVDMTKMKRTDEDAWWLNIYVMLSRAVALDHLLLFNAPVSKEEWDALKPPQDLLTALSRLEALSAQTRARMCRRP